MTKKITCKICHAEIHAVSVHLKESHEDWTIEQYQESFPKAPLLSALAKKKIAERKAAKKQADKEITAKQDQVFKPMYEVFDLDKSDPRVLRADGSPVLVEIFPDHEDEAIRNMVPKIDPNYEFDIDLLKDSIMAFTLKMPLYLWGHAGVGKTTFLLQICARTNRPHIRVQHTGGTEECHILGQMAANEEGTYFEAGPLPFAMKHGIVYIADEYDFAIPQTLSVYQPVLENNDLLIKEAPTDSGWRFVENTEDFYLCATGNTNGSGDEFNLYLGTNIQNAANYERFQVMEQVLFPPKDKEIMLVANQAMISKEDAELLVEFAHRIRENFEKRKIGLTIGARTLIAAAKIGVARASFLTGIKLSFINRLTRKDREIASQIAQRLFGEE